jgi:glutaminyl-tRNA synthetase
MKDGSENYLKYLNQDSLKTVTAYVEPLLGESKPGESFQFERTGYFCADAVDSKPGKPVFNRTVTLKDGYKPV